MPRGTPRFALLLKVVSALVVFSSACMAKGFDKKYVTTADGRQPMPIIAVDNVCAWPNLTVLSDGIIAATIFNQPNHGLAAGDVEVWTSGDAGRTWQKAGTPAPHEPTGNRMNTAAGLSKNGDLLVMASGWSNKYPPRKSGEPDRWAGKYGKPYRAAILGSWLCRSSDGGRTWCIDKKAVPQKSSNGLPFTPFGDIVQGDDGVLRTSMYTWDSHGPRSDHLFIIESRDDGRTWDKLIPLDYKKFLNETALLNLGGNKWLAVAADTGLFCYTSSDNCKRWQAQGRIAAAQKRPPHLLRLKDGRILLSYGDRTGTVHGVEVLTSSDEGRTWSEPLRVVDWWGDGGYPSSVQLPDGQILTAYYAEKIKGHDRYHMGVVIWDPKSL